MTTIYRAAPNGSLFRWSPGTGWVEVAEQPGQSEDVEELMRGRTPQEAESGRRALRRRAVRQGRQLRESNDPAVIQEEALAMAQGKSIRHPWLKAEACAPKRPQPVAPGRLQLPQRRGTTVISGGMTAT